MTTEPIQPKPPWLRRRLPSGPQYERIRSLIKNQCLSTVCQEAMCPNQFECFGQGTATFMLLGDRCSRNCRFCAVGHGPQSPPDPDEPARVAEAVETMGLSYCVLTSVTRDDLADGGAGHFAAAIRAIRERNPHTLIEVLIPDFQGNHQALQTVVEARPEVLNHNLETVVRLYPTVRPQADYQQSLAVLQRAKTMASSMVTKCGIMVGLGETEVELGQLFADLTRAGCDILTIGQYLQPSRAHLEVVRYLPPSEFALLEQQALAMGLKAVASAPFVRSSYQAEALYRRVLHAVPSR
ncbi:lipoic acid synthetase [Desulfobulbus propionicus DSM 2032]|jgi:lipoic acid synthetase|uniref:Lipoyl synthase n=1 Tax=Desulfobulbus propionicus (strain ATCC 33891 / DSM 2032 / VKM B-1956 / 1pr3) TaxID=577650 RepID=A0A7U4DQ91_DESPD|nr:lipoyl synthase [Desulfobulbus propionicus]ADW18864.1 lipoic acid synthetase [Desulfobulbus propionicus DSM 2032]